MSKPVKPEEKSSLGRFAAGLLALIWATGTVVAQDTSGNAPFTPNDLRSTLSTDTTPINVKIGKVTYAIPLNYLGYPVNGLPVTLRVTNPGFLPLTEETRPCMEHKIWQTCLPIEINVDQGPSNATIMSNSMQGLPWAKQSDHPFGFDYYLLGPEDSRSETYRLEKENILIDCGVFKTDTEHAICTDFIDIDPQNSIKASIFLVRTQISQVPEINRRVTEILNSMKVSDHGN